MTPWAEFQNAGAYRWPTRRPHLPIIWPLLLVLPVLRKSPISGHKVFWIPVCPWDQQVYAVRIRTGDIQLAQPSPSAAAIPGADGLAISKAIMVPHGILCNKSSTARETSPVPVIATCASCGRAIGAASGCTRQGRLMSAYLRAKVSRSAKVIKRKVDDICCFCFIFFC